MKVCGVYVISDPYFSKITIFKQMRFDVEKFIFMKTSKPMRKCLNFVESDMYCSPTAGTCGFFV
jgi:hypothetical protein